MVKLKMKSSLEVNRDFWRDKSVSERNKSFSRKFEDMDHDMNEKFSVALKDENFDSHKGRLEVYFKRFLSVVYEKDHDNRFQHLELRDMDLRYPTLVLGIDADSIIRNAREIQYALFTFLDEWYPELDYSNILLEWC